MKNAAIVSSKGVMYQDDAERFVCCECEQCSFASACDCQGPSELVDGNGRKIFAYTDDVSCLPSNQSGSVLESYCFIATICI